MALTLDEDPLKSANLEYELAVEKSNLWKPVSRTPHPQEESLHTHAAPHASQAVGKGERKSETVGFTLSIRVETLGLVDYSFQQGCFSSKVLCQDSTENCIHHDDVYIYIYIWVRVGRYFWVLATVTFLDHQRQLHLPPGWLYVEPPDNAVGKGMNSDGNGSCSAAAGSFSEA